LLFFVFLFAHEARANVGLSIQPLKVSHTLEKGETISGSIQITNVSDDAVSVETKIEDFIPMPGTNDIQFVGRSPGVSTVRDWITMDSPKTMTLKKGEVRAINYTIVAPENAEPGGHFGVLFFKANQLSAVGQQLKVGTQVGMLVLVTIPGSHLQKGRIVDFSGPSFVKQGEDVRFNIKFENTGTVHFEPKGEIVVTNLIGKEIAKVPVEGQVVLPTGVKDLVAMAHPSGIMIGRYAARLTLYDGEGNELTAESVSFYAFPIWYAAGFIAILIILYFLIRFFKKRLKISISLNKNG
jgi:hypothetical protein